MASFNKGDLSAGGSKQNSNISISLTRGNLESQLESIRSKTSITKDEVKKLVDKWVALQEMVGKNKLTLDEATDIMKDYLNEYGIKVDETTKKFNTQKEKIKDVELQSKVSTTEEIKDQENYADSISRVNELLNEQANLLNKYRLSTANRLTGDNVDKIITKIGMNLNSGREDDKIKNDILRSIAYAGTYDTETLKRVYKFLNVPDDPTVPIKGKYKYSSDISRGLKDPNILPDINDLLAMAILNPNEFENYAKSQPDYDDLWKDYERFQARLWNSGTFKGNSQDFVDMTDIADRYLTHGIENKNAFMNALGIDNTSLRQKAQQAKDDIIKTLETGIYEKANVPLSKNYDEMLSNYHTQRENMYNNLFANTPALDSALAMMNEWKQKTNELTETSQKSANEIVTKAQQATPAIEQATQATHTLGQKLGSFAQDVIAIFTKIGRDMSLTFRDFGNSIRTWSSVMYSAIHLAQALENTMNVSDSMTAIAYRLERYDTTGASRQTLLNRAFSRANNARSDIDSYATLAQRILATNVTNGNADEAMRLASLITKSMVLGGSTAQEQRSAQLQLSQALASNILGGDELRAIRENAIGFTEMLARGLTRGYQQGVFSQPEFSNVQIGNLKELGKKQLLTADVVTKAISLMEEEINKDFTTMPELFSQTMAKLMNTFKKRLNEFNQEGKGLGRIVKLFQDLQKWLDSDKGKQVLDSLLDVFDKFIDKISQIVSIVGDILNGPIGKALLELVKIKIWALPITMGSKLLLGSSDIYGNQRAGLLGYGGVLNILSRMFQLGNAGGNPLTGMFSAETINGRTFAMGGLIPNIFSMGVQLINSLTGRNFGDNFATTVLLQKTLMNMLSNNKATSASSLYETLRNTGIKQLYLDETFYKNINSIGQISGKAIPSNIASSLLDNNVFAHLASNTATAGVGNALGNPIANAFGAKGGIIGKALGVAAAHPIATAIVGALAVIGIGVGVRNHFDKKADEEAFNNFYDNLPNPAHWSKLQEEDRNSLRSKARDWYFKYTTDKFFGGQEKNWSDKDYEKFIRDYVDFGDNAYGRYLKSIADNTGKTASNTAGTLDITDEFIRNMNDIRTRSFRGELLMNGNGVNNTWNVVVHNEGDVKNIAEKIQQAVISAQEGMLNTPVMM